MSYHESTLTKLNKLINNPRTYIGKILPFTLSKIEPYKRDILESFGNDRLSKPYPGHEKLMQYITNTDGFFVECGGNDGHFQDPTYYLEKFRDWKGVIVEPLPIGNLCKRNRKKSTIYKVALISKGDKRETVDFIDINAMSFIEGSIENEEEWIAAGKNSQKIEQRKISVSATTIQQIIDDYNHGNQVHKQIDLFIVDVEGSELEVLKGLDFEINSPLNILVEAHTDKRLSDIREFLSREDYELITHIGDNDYLFKKDR